jgi:hypothetical protein
MPSRNERLETIRGSNLSMIPRSRQRPNCSYSTFLRSIIVHGSIDATGLKEVHGDDAGHGRVHATTGCLSIVPASSRLTPQEQRGRQIDIACFVACVVYLFKGYGHFFEQIGSLGGKLNPRTPESGETVGSIDKMSSISSTGSRIWRQIVSPLHRC